MAGMGLNLSPTTRSELAMKRVLFVVLVTLVLLSCLGVFLPLDLLIALTVGWGFYVYRVVPQIHVNWTGVATACLCLLGLAIGLHLFLAWLSREWQAKAAPTTELIDPIAVGSNQSDWPV